MLLLLRIAQSCQSPCVSLPPLLGPWRADIPALEIDELHYIFIVKPGHDLALQNTQAHASSCVVKSQGACEYRFFVIHSQRS